MTQKKTKKEVFLTYLKSCAILQTRTSGSTCREQCDFPGSPPLHVEQSIPDGACVRV